MNTMLLEAQPTSLLGTGGMIGQIVVWILLMGVLFYFMILKPQKKQQKQMDEMLRSLKPGDSVLTTSGFYGVVLDIMEDTVIVEFGNNKNCRIPMKIAAIAEVDHGDAAPEEDSKKKK